MTTALDPTLALELRSLLLQVDAATATAAAAEEKAKEAAERARSAEAAALRFLERLRTAS